MTQSRALVMIKNNERPPQRTKSKWVTRRLYDSRLHEMLTYKRPHDTIIEVQWTKMLLEPYSPILLDDSAWVVEVPRPDGTLAPVMFSGHVDTVHRTEGRQKVWFDPKAECYFKEDGEPLGADDAAGVWLMLNMIDARVPGTYVFHRGEERGGIGSSDLAETRKEWLRSFNMAVAFDRRGTYDVITHQGWGRCCSDKFAEALSDALNYEGMMYAPCDSGVFTDTANYTELIPECTNLSCGYDMEHTGWETLHLPHLFAMRDALIRVNWEALPVARDPNARRDDRWDNWRDKTSVGGSRYSTSFDDVVFDLVDYTLDELTDLVYQDPEGFVERVWTELLGHKLPRKSDDDDDDVHWSESSFH